MAEQEVDNTVGAPPLERQDSLVKDRVKQYEDLHKHMSEQVTFVRRTVSDSNTVKTRQQRVLQFKSRSVAFLEVAGKDDVKPRLCRTPTPFWPDDHKDAVTRDITGVGTIPESECISEENEPSQ